jgi:hypothetical protein
VHEPYREDSQGNVQMDGSFLESLARIKFDCFLTLINKRTTVCDANCTMDFSASIPGDLFIWECESERA